MTYKGFRIDRKLNVFGLKDELLAKEQESLDAAKEFVDDYIDKKKNGGKETADTEERER